MLLVIQHLSFLGRAMCDGPALVLIIMYCLLFWGPKGSCWGAWIFVGIGGILLQA